MFYLQPTLQCHKSLKMLKMTAPYATQSLRVFKKGLNFVFQKRYFARSSYPWIDASPVAEVEVNFGEQNLKLQTGNLARSVDGAAVAKLGDTAVLATAVCQKQSGSQSFLPLTGDYRQKAAVARKIGRIPTRHEFGVTEKEILISQIIDRSVRPLFPPGFCYNTQLVFDLLHVDGIDYPDVISINAASAALAVSDIPWNGPVAAVRVGILGEDVVINPTRRQLQKSSFNVVLTGNINRKVVMLNGEAERAGPRKIEQVLSQALEATEGIIEKIKALQAAVGKPKREFDPSKEPSQQLVDALQRCDGQGLSDLRDISCAVDDFEGSDGSALFQQGQTRVVCTIAFDSLDSAVESDLDSTVESDIIAVVTGTFKEKNLTSCYIVRSDNDKYW